jgi:transposase-like protein
MSHVRFAEDVKRHAADLALHSDLAVTEIARQTGCSVNTLHSWIKKYRQEQKVVTETPTPPTFVPVTLVDPKPTSIEIVTPNGFIVRLVDAPLSLGELLAAVASC